MNTYEHISRPESAQTNIKEIRRSDALFRSQPSESVPSEERASSIARSNAEVGRVRHTRILHVSEEKSQEPRAEEEETGGGGEGRRKRREEEAYGRAGVHLKEITTSPTVKERGRQSGRESRVTRRSGRKKTKGARNRKRD
ncbi:unnamed protein product [Pleuronectes platessa]|uniref:Uncharacterized protein n=1 Tax=Pleuronectes platessa TaxID=8262 RepID=A0A9N7YQL7_PLEPL|nr:unnamed protein product [Pleuronectes platessa]